MPDNRLRIFVRAEFQRRIELCSGCPQKYSLATPRQKNQCERRFYDRLVHVSTVNKYTGVHIHVMLGEQLGIGILQKFDTP